ncbi:MULTISPECIES: malate dehydrogenase [Archaeoglobus]|jgi:malate dehydrogenase|uniref:Malate dehydrogenase n=3 Tax=Archaeoglobus fulgidus TaxID=2234 RepID=MDH_ARCFU|nr:MULTISPECIES: malate dehydrogenase [Archaeoglobus]O08349.1 RecName: Full=Malate dehydrogenase [Archaeoglobus fulgidus DSM 4304]2X0I_A Chain A, MALATE DEHYDROGENASE [Archaeoglobus fulgidus DSM 4304]2X0J_A Chain A, Malate Dehydrogenase [Archaeoglobus fulgidus DSM 4304]AAB90384.1 L-malate dehydrogenase, NAD+-dependent (mdhA) [Archaeoglobus fulgidus DSM 4304]AIG97731.1 Malate/lactate dehydrogenase [Archaeoglobus fulgidus DSM 8774]KUJ93702.1 MAG: Malate dehydrogenase [Archaeoglobus fulgidus]KU
MKLGFVGAGRVGSTSAFTCLLNLDVDEIALVDIAEDLAVGEAMDLAHAAAGIDKYPKIVGGADYSLLKGSEIIVVTAGLARKPGMTRLDLAHKNAGIIKDIAKKIVENAPESKILVVTNPMDVMTYIMWKESGKPRNEVFGMGNQLDSQRLKERLYNAGARNIRRAWIIGEHGDSMFVAKSLADFDGEVDWEAVENDVRFVAAEVIKRKGATIFGPAVAIYRMVKAVVEDTGEIIPTSMILQGEYGIENVAVGVPAKLGKNGAEVADIKLSDEEIEKLRNSAKILRERLEELGY